MIINFLYSIPSFLKQSVTEYEFHQENSISSRPFPEELCLQCVLFSQLTNESPSQSIFTHARQRIQAGEELQSAQSSVQEQEVESDKEAGSEGEDDDEEVM